MKTSSEITRMETTSTDKQLISESIFRRCNGIIGVPISFLDKYCPEQFIILGLSRDTDLHGKRGMDAEFVRKYFEQGNTGQIMEGHPDLGYYDANGRTIVPYRRVIIQKRIGQCGKDINYHD